MSFSQDPIGSAIGSANAITVQSGLIPRGRLIGPSCPTDRQTDGPGGGRKGCRKGRWGRGVSAALSRHSLTPSVTQRCTWWWFSPTSPTGPVKITAGSAAPLPAPTCLRRISQGRRDQELLHQTNTHEGGGTCNLVLFAFFCVYMCVDAAGLQRSAACQCSRSRGVISL